MNYRTLYELLGELSREYGNIKVSSVCSDSRRLERGGAFVAIRGLHSDGHFHLREAEARGAVALIVERGAPREETCLPCIEVENSREALARMLDALYSHPTESMKIVAVTGTNGKTSVSSMLFAIFKAWGKSCGLIGTLGCRFGKREISLGERLANMTTPDPEVLYDLFAQMRDARVEYVFIEASSHALELSKLAPISFCASVFTNLTPEHLDFHGDMTSYAEAKAKLFAASDISVINVDDSYARLMAEKSGGRVVSCSRVAQDADYFAELISGEFPTEYDLWHSGEKIHIRSRIGGDFSVMNTLEAAVCALELGVDRDTVVRALEELRGVCGRLEKVEFEDKTSFSVYIDYAHTPDALENLLRSINATRSADQRLVLLFGCGGDRDRSKRAPMGRIATEGADLVIITSDNNRSENKKNIISDILEGVGDADNYVVIEDRRDAIEYAVRNARERDIILLAGKGHEKYEICDGKRLSFDEREIVKEFAAKYRYKDL